VGGRVPSGLSSALACLADSHVNRDSGEMLRRVT
jgi:hypothetical protein